MNTLISVVKQSCGEREPSRSPLEILLSGASWCAIFGGALFLLCAEHVRQLEGESPFDNLMEVKS
jgi:hypothetical protein